MKITSKHMAGLLAAMALTSGSTSLQAQPTNLTLYNFDSDQVSTTPYGTAWNNWFGAAFGGVFWDPANDANNNPASGSMVLQLNWPPGDQYVLNDGINPAPNWGPFNIQTVWTNLSFDMRYDVSSAIRTNAVGAGVNGSLGVGSLDFGYMRVGSRSPSFAQDWFNYFAVSATNGAGLPNTNWIHKDIDLTGVIGAFGDLSAGLINIMFGMDGNSYGNAGLVGAQTIWFDNIKFTGFVAPVPPPTLSIESATPKALWLFGGSGLYGRSQVALQDTSAAWINGTFPVKYSFTILDNATSPGALQTGIQFIGGNPGDASFWDYGADNVLWLRIISGTGTDTTCVADVSWKTNAPGSNPDQHNIALMITNPVLAGTWTLTFLSNTNGTLTAPGGSPAPFSLALDDAAAQLAFAAPVQVRFGHENFGNTANGGVPHYWANISVTNAFSGINVNEDFTKKDSTQLDPAIWNLNTSDGIGVINLVPTNAPYWVKWTQPDAGFTLVSAGSIGGISEWSTLANVTPISQGGRTWALIPSASLPAGSERYFALIKRPFTQLQVLLPGETNAPNTVTGKIGTPDPVSLGAGGSINVTVNAVDPTYHIVTTASGNLIGLTSSDPNSIPPLAPGALVNGTVTQQLFFGSTGNFTITATNNSNISMPTATSSSVTVGP